MPAGWKLEETKAHDIRLLAPDGRKALLAPIRRKALAPKDSSSLAWPSDRLPLVLAPFLSERTREVLAGNGISYADGTGNVRLAVSSPAVFIETVGADRNPKRVPRSLQSLRGAAAGRVVRALCEFRPPFGIRTLAEASGTPLGTVSRVVGLLEEEALLTRDAHRQVVTVDWASLLARWAKDYGVSTTNSVMTCLDPRGLAHLWPKLSRLKRYAATGSVAGPGIAPTRLAMLYVDDAHAAAKTLDLVPADAGANVFLIEPFDDVVFERTRTARVAGAGGETTVTATALPQTVVDLLTSPGRGPNEADALVQQMKERLDDWRLTL